MKIQTLLAEGARRAATELETALMQLPADKRNWSAGGAARSAIDMVAEVALLNGDTADMILTKTGLANFDADELNRRKAALDDDWPALKALLDENTARVAEAINASSDEDLTFEFAMPWGAMTMTQIIEYPYWNAKYHEGQINFIASILGVEQG